MGLGSHRRGSYLPIPPRILRPEPTVALRMLICRCGRGRPAKAVRFTDHSVNLTTPTLRRGCGSNTSWADENVSITVDYFFNAIGTADEVGESVGHVLGVRFESQGQPADLFFCRFLSMELSFGRHDLENDRDCTFEEFEFQLCLRTATPDAILRACQVEAMVLIAYALHVKGGIEDSLLVFDAQRVLARYTSAVIAGSDFGSVLHDRVSGKEVRFPEHLVDVERRITRANWRE